jgi:hypothetical protein
MKVEYLLNFEPSLIQHYFLYKMATAQLRLYAVLSSVKCKVIHGLTHHAMKTLWGNEGIAPSFSVHAPNTLPPRNQPPLPFV